MSVRKWAKRVGQKAGGQIKRSTRKAAPALTRASIYITGAAAAVGTYFGTPVAGAAITAIGGQHTQYFGGVKARSEGKHGAEARRVGRKERQRAWVAGAIGTGVGGLGGLVGPGGYGTSSGLFAGSAPAAAPVATGGSIYGDSLPALVPAIEAAPLPAAAPSALPGFVGSLSEIGGGGAAASGGGLTGIGWLDAGLGAVGSAGLSQGVQALGGLLGPGGNPAPVPTWDPNSTLPPGGGLGGGGGSDVPGGSDGSNQEGYRHEAAAAQAEDNKPLLYLAGAGLVLVLLSR